MATDPGTAAATERPGPTPIVGEVKPAPEVVDLVTAVFRAQDEEAATAAKQPAA